MFVRSSLNPSRASRRGLTLLEMVVVIAILIVLAGVLVPLMPNLQFDAHCANGATNNVELGKALETYRVIQGKYPDGYELMLSSSGAPNAYQFFANSAGTGFNANSGCAAHSLSAVDVASLAAASIGFRRRRRGEHSREAQSVQPQASSRPEGPPLPRCRERGWRHDGRNPALCQCCCASAQRAAPLSTGHRRRRIDAECYTLYWFVTALNRSPEHQP